ncbi:hypothetical protein ACOQM6_09295, partial [Lactobacillus paragasseri]
SSERVTSIGMKLAPWPLALTSYFPDLDEMLDNAHSYDGKPLDDHDRELIRQYLNALLNK